ncbi:MULTISPECIES: hypothetical protein [Paenibacillus]|uniref:hypothetical protein n=1 Tax=Paenibacillus TaxID=44249 RepID=UPI0022B8F216|nr:hypothetical protein [Paenibacillus caseinilyticus]MCZ8520738.1 hypothetical protein [Paenibacillus caseinilyticus]
MNEMWGWVGIIGGPGFGLIIWWVARRAGVRSRQIDERYLHGWLKARSAAWFCTLAAILLLFVLYRLGVRLSVPETLGILLMAHLVSWGAAGTYHTIRG